MNCINRMIVGTFFSCFFTVAIQAADAARKPVGKLMPKKFTFSERDQRGLMLPEKKIYGLYPDMRVTLQNPPQQVPSDDEVEERTFLAVARAKKINPNMDAFLFVYNERQFAKEQECVRKRIPGENAGGALLLQ